MKRIEAEADLYEGGENPDEWIVWVHDGHDGGILTTLFAGPGSRERAEEYALAKCRGFRLRERDQPQYRSDQRPALRLVR